MNRSEIFSIALGLASPWYVKQVEFLGSSDNLSKELHLYLDFARGHRFTDVQGKESSAYDTVDKM